MASFIVTDPSGAIAPITFEHNRERFRVQFYVRPKDENGKFVKGRFRDNPKWMTGIEKSYLKAMWSIVRQKFEDEGCTIECNTWVSDHLYIEPIGWNTNRRPDKYKAYAALVWRDQPPITVEAEGSSAEAAVSAFWATWRDIAKENDYRTDVALTGSERHPSRAYVMIARNCPH